METISVVGRPIDEYAKPAIRCPVNMKMWCRRFLRVTPQKPDDPPNYEQLEQALEMAYDHMQNRKAEAGKSNEED
jgi:hypothetical protein